MFANHVSDKGLESRIYKELSKQKKKKQRKWAKDSNRYFTERDIQVASTWEDVIYQKPL